MSVSPHPEGTNGGLPPSSMEVLQSENPNTTDRYICVVDDEPLIFSAAKSDRQVAFDNVHDEVIARMRANGAGTGFVLDTVTNTVIGILDGWPMSFGPDTVASVRDVPLPTGQVMANLVQTLRGWHDGTMSGPNSVYPTWLIRRC